MAQQAIVKIDGHLKQTMPEILKQLYVSPSMSSGAYIYSTSDLGINTKLLEEWTSRVTGETDVSTELSDEIPESVITFDRDEYKTWQIPQGFTIKYLEADAWAMADAQPIGAAFLNAPAEESLNIILNKSCVLRAYGRNNTRGLLNNQNVPTDASVFNFYASATTPQQRLDFLIEQYISIKTANNIETETGYLPDTLMMSTEAELYMIRPTIQIGGTLLSVRSAFEQTFPGVNIIFTGWAAASLLERYSVQAAGTARDRMLFYTRNSGKVVSTKTSAPMWLPSSYQKGSYWSAAVQNFSQVMWHRPKLAKMVTYSNTKA